MESIEPSRTMSKSKFKQIKLNNTEMKGEQAAEGSYLFHFVNRIKKRNSVEIRSS